MGLCISKNLCRKRGKCDATQSASWAPNSSMCCAALSGLVCLYIQPRAPLKLNLPCKMVRMFNDHHIMRQLHDLLPLLLLRACGQHKQGIVHSLQQLLFVFSPQLVVVRPIDDLLVYPL